MLTSRPLPTAFETEALKSYADAIPAEESFELPAEAKVGNDEYLSEIARQAQLTLLAFKTGVAVSADLHVGAFDTHAGNDAGQGWPVANLTDGLDYLSEYADKQGLADRLFVVIGPDLRSTNFCNTDEGKDRCLIGSFLIMAKNQPWTNRAVGETEGRHFAQKINPRTLERDDANDTIIHPKPLHMALRSYLGIESSAGAQRFPYSGTEDLTFFG